MLTDLMLMLYLNIYLDNSLSDKVNLNINWNSLITVYNHSFITANSSASDFFKFCWITSKCLTVL